MKYDYYYVRNIVKIIIFPTIVELTYLIAMSHETHDSKSSFKLKHLAVLLQCRIAVKTPGQKNE